MTGLVIDLWQDLREKRLWPVAVGMLAALVAMPVVLFKPASSPPQQPLPRVSGPTGVQLPVSSVSTTSGSGSALEKYIERDPFMPLASLSSASTTAKPATSSSATGSGTQSANTTTHTASSGGSGGGTSSPSSSGTTPSTTSSGGSSQTVTHRYYSWEVDLKFGHPGHEQAYDSIKTLGMLPNTQNPVVTFMGVEQTNAGDEAVFFIPDPDIVAYGKAGCNNSGGACRFVYLDTSGHSSEYFATLDGSKKYRLDLVDIKTYTLSNPPQVSGSSAGATAAAQEDAGLALQSLASFASP